MKKDRIKNLRNMSEALDIYYSPEIFDISVYIQVVHHSGKVFIEYGEEYQYNTGLEEAKSMGITELAKRIKEAINENGG